MPYSRHVTGGVDHLWNADAHGYAVIRSCGAIGKRGCTSRHVTGGVDHLRNADVRRSGGWTRIDICARDLFLTGHIAAKARLTLCHIHRTLANGGVGKRRSNQRRMEAGTDLSPFLQSVLAEHSTTAWLPHVRELLTGWVYLWID